MRVLYVYWSEFREDQAHANQIVHTCNALNDRGHGVTVIAAGDIKSYAEIHDLPLRFKHYRVPQLQVAGKTGRAFYYLVNLLSAQLFDVIFTRDISFLRVIRAFPFPLSTPVVYEAHKVYSYIDQVSEGDELSRCQVADKIVTISQGIADDLSELGVEVAGIVPDAADVSQLPTASETEIRTSLGIPSDEKLVVYTGSLSTWKNDLGLTIDAFASVVAERPEVRLSIVGGGSELEELRKRARETAPSEAIKFPGHVSQSTVFDYLAVADVGVVPLRPVDRIATRYTSPLKLYEYLVSDINVVAAEVPSITSATADIDGVFTYEPGNLNEFVRALQRALDAPRPKRSPDDFSYARRAKQLESIFSTALS
ncbi:glycosyltransferase [Salinibaculum rarum]|uniref:glycosyltransferase n=1 Tax=Salinibaculum rarum TaxID=3058903 RepID=UPI00265DC79B|nr:glycosyltransferase [Salinibaculum sp. KK48]